MEILISAFTESDSTVIPQYVVDEFESFIWTVRHNVYGDFELRVMATKTNISIFKINRFVQIADSDRVMIIESVATIVDAEEGNKLKITGRSLESILDRRIVWNRITFDAGKPVQSVIKKLLTDAFMTDGKRKVENFVFDSNSALKDFPAITDEESQGYGAQYFGENLYDVITELCSYYGLGFKIALNSSNNFVFHLYMGKDHSYGNEDNNAYVIFSPDFENLINSNYYESKIGYKTTVLIVGEGEGDDQKRAGLNTSKSGFYRREMFVDASDISSQTLLEDGSQVTISPEAYTALLKQRAKEERTEHAQTVSFESELETLQQFVYGKDYKIGDIVQVEDGFDHNWKCRVIEVIVSYDTDGGYRIYPTFETVAEAED